MPSSAALLEGGANVDLEESQRGRIIGSCVAIFIITDLFVALRLISRKLARAGYWVSSLKYETEAMTIRFADNLFVVGRCLCSHRYGESGCEAVREIRN